MINGYRNLITSKIRDFNGLVMISKYNSNFFSGNEIDTISQLLTNIDNLVMNRIIKVDSYIKKNRNIIPTTIIGANLDNLVDLGVIESVKFYNNQKNHILLSDNFLEKN